MLLPATTSLTRDEARTIGIAALTAACVSAATGLVTWAIDEAKRRVTQRREAIKVPPTNVGG